jgi:hypothetical protein
MDCRTWPPFYEKEVDGKCVSTPPPPQDSLTSNLLGIGAVVLVVLIPFFVLSKSK